MAVACNMDATHRQPVRQVASERRDRHHGVEGQPAQLQPWRIRCVRVHAALGPDTTQNRFELTTQVKSGVNFTSDFHTFGLKWKSPHNLHRRRIKCGSLRQHIGAGLLGPRRLRWQRPLQSMEGQREQRSLRSPLLLGHQPCSRWTTGYFPDVVNVSKPWQNNQGGVVNHFYNVIDSWMPIWSQDFEIDLVRVWKYQEVQTTKDNPTKIWGVISAKSTFSLWTSKPTL